MVVEEKPVEQHLEKPVEQNLEKPVVQNETKQESSEIYVHTTSEESLDTNKKIAPESREEKSNDKTDD